MTGNCEISHLLCSSSPDAGMVDAWPDVLRACDVCWPPALSELGSVVDVRSRLDSGGVSPGLRVESLPPALGAAVIRCSPEPSRGASLMGLLVRGRGLDAVLSRMA